MSTPAIILNNSPDTWGELPLPGDAIVTLPGLALAYAMSSGIVLAATVGFTAMTYGARIILGPVADTARASAGGPRKPRRRILEAPAFPRRSASWRPSVRQPRSRACSISASTL